jgi:photosystem II stability/assembly factor-like uncharacterized protein
MTGNLTLCVGTIGSGAWTSPDGGESWRRVGRGLGNESRVYGLAHHPTEPRILFAGADDGLYRSDDGGQSFAHLDSPMNKMDVWKIAFDPSDPQTMFAGTRPAALFRSRDGGRGWTRLPVEMVEDCPNVGVPRVTALTVDPSDSHIVWAGVEVDGVRRSLDGGDSWTRIMGGLDDPDIHDVAVRPAGGGETVLTSTPREIFASTDKGESWQRLGVGKHFGLPYCRGLALKADDPNTVFVATGDAAVGSTGAIQRSKDGGKSWQTLPLPAEPNSPIWNFATHMADPGVIVACSHYGELFASDNAGDTWKKLRREFTEIRAVSWVPN